MLAPNKLIVYNFFWLINFLRKGSADFFRAKSGKILEKYFVGCSCSLTFFTFPNYLNKVLNFLYLALRIFNLSQKLNVDRNKNRNS